ncbi:MAG TPA: lipopolysaccharide heptosyltransferase II [Gemmatimonadaceae bacterium]|nr:lipopolysaccharide heptosyltransferase II [Gemmatimonadaceae bacterium]
MTASLVVQTSFLGDTVLTTPLLAWLARSGPVDVLCTPAAGALLENHPAVRRVILYDKRGEDRGWRGMLQLAATLRQGEYASAYFAQGSVRSGMLGWLARIPDRVGFAGSAGRRFYTAKIAPIENMHHAARLLSLGTRDPLAPVPPSELRPRLYPGEREKRTVDELLAANRATNDQLIALAPGSVWATKRWPYYAELAALLTGDARTVVIGSAADRELAEAIVRGAKGRAIDATGKLSLLASAELIRRASAIVTNDSSPLHLASAMNTPTVAIFGPTVPEFGFGPLAEHSVVLGHASLACRPCDRHGPKQCPLGHWRCMREITPEDVARAVRNVVSAAKASTLSTP